jgi:hypothetical protein
VPDNLDAVRRHLSPAGKASRTPPAADFRREMLRSQGGTAINLFERNMPCLSVGIDLSYVPIRPHPESLAAIDAAMGRTAVRIKRLIPGATISEGRNDEGKRTHLVARAEAVQCEIEVTPVLRGCEDVDGRDEPGPITADSTRPGTAIAYSSALTEPRRSRRDRHRGCPCSRTNSRLPEPCNRAQSHIRVWRASKPRGHFARPATPQRPARSRP